MSDELDDIASAYVDGEATPEEVRRVESDPDLLDVVAEFTLLSGSLQSASPARDELRQQHIAAAMAEFDALQDAGENKPAAGASVVGLNTARKRKPRSTSWLASAAATVAIVGGVGFAATQLPSGGEDSGDASSFDADSTSSDDGSDDAQAGSAAGQAALAGERQESAEIDAMADEAMSDDAMEEEDEASVGIAEDSDTEDDDEESTSAAADSETVPSPTASMDASGTETASDLLVAYQAEGFTDDDLGPPEDALCLGEIEAVPPGTEVGFVDITYGTTDAALLIFVIDGNRNAVLHDLDCQVISID